MFGVILHTAEGPAVIDEDIKEHPCGTPSADTWGPEGKVCLRGTWVKEGGSHKSSPPPPQVSLILLSPDTYSLIHEALITDWLG